MPYFKSAFVCATLVIPLALALAGISNPAQADPRPAAVGFWLSPLQGWVIETKSCDSGICGFLVSFLKGKSVEHVVRDKHNPDPTKRNAPLCGLKLLDGFTPSADVPGQWDNGWVYDPETGSTYKGTAEVINTNTVRVRGYVLIPLFGRTITLTRMVGAVDRCSVPAQAEPDIESTVAGVVEAGPITTGNRR